MEWNGMEWNGMEWNAAATHFIPQHYTREDINSKNNLKRLYS
jgi:hypothetical protein